MTVTSENTVSSPVSSSTGHTLYMATLGCDKNVVDSEIMNGIAVAHGFQCVDDPADATVIVVNTCGFIDVAKEQSIQTILDMADYKVSGRLQALIVAGCLTQRYKETLLQEMPEIDGIVGTGDFIHLKEIIEEALLGTKPARVGAPTFDYEHIVPRKRLTKTHFAHVKLSEGCDHACTFCSIPLMRGKFRSRSMESIIAEVTQLVAEGVREVSLIAQDLTNYGRDLYKTLMLPQLLRKLADISDLRWIRLHYVYPGLFNEALLQEITNNPKVCKYIDMPLQHSEDDILRAMRRPGRQRNVRELITHIRQAMPQVALRTSIIVGFPGETEAHFERLLDFVREMSFDRLGVFTYSQEEDTPAAQLPHQVADDVKERRAAQLMEVQRQVVLRMQKKRIGQTIDVMIERYDATQEVYVGRSQYDAPEIDGEVFVKGDQLVIGEIVPVRVSHAIDYDLCGVRA